MKLIIAGGRDYKLSASDYRDLYHIHLTYRVSEVVSGCARGADSCGESWATLNDIPIKKFEASWAKDGRSAGPQRNERMASYADALAIFPGGNGSQDMLKRAIRKGLRIFNFMDPGSKQLKLELNPTESASLPPPPPQPLL